MSYLPIERLEQLRIGTVGFVSPSEIRVSLEIDSPDSVSLQGGSPRNFPRINSYVLISSDEGFLVGQVEWIAVEHSPYPKRKGLQDFGLIDLPFPLKKLSINPVGTLRIDRKSDGFKFSRGTDAFPSVGDSVLLPTDQQLRSIIESGENRRVKIGDSPLANNAEIKIDPDRLFGRHVAVLGNTGSGKSCSVAGLIQWSLDAVLRQEQTPNARFIILDPNGEYNRAFGPLSKYKGHLLRVEANSEAGELDLKVPSWLWNSSEWGAFTQASSKVQLPLLRRALRAMRNDVLSADDITIQAKHFCGILLVAMRQLASQGQIYVSGGHAKGLVESLMSWESSLSTLNEKIASQPFNSLLSTINTFLSSRRGIQWPAKPEVSDTDRLIADLKESHVALGGDEQELLPKSEDTPVRFEGDDFVAYLEALAQETGTEQFVEFLLTRIRTMLGDTRISAVTKDSDQPISLTNWLDTFLGKDTHGAITVIDLSLVPNEIIHLVTAVISRVTFEALQRYRKMNGKPLPTVMVAEEAHTFIKRYKEESESQSVSDVCCKVFEKIAREGRKFGLGLVVSSQRPSELSPTVLSQCNTFLLHRISNDRDQEQVHRLVPDNMRGLLRELPSLPSRHAILLGWASELPVLVRMKELTEEQRPQSDDPDFWNVWSNSTAEPREVNWQLIAEEWQNRD
ncbi:ATP-binding protein [Vibrio sp. CB1-14]|uniref:ATP-binding protein n=1 Tax=Vibrio chaetopteri TaxID=3016528 RepID=A0AAU8BM29_9VIBR